jgi:hypothetical protein
MGGIKLHSSPAQTWRCGAWIGTAAKRSRPELSFCLSWPTSIHVSYPHWSPKLQIDATM